VGWRAGSPPEGGSGLLALDTCVVQQRGERLDPAAEEEEAQSRGMPWPRTVFLDMFSNHMGKEDGNYEFKKTKRI